MSLVAILDADQEGFLRSDRSLIQTVGRAARHVSGRAIFYADRMTDSMRRCIEETNRRRIIQQEHNREHNITPTSVVKSADEVRFITRVADAREQRAMKVAERAAQAQYEAKDVDAAIAQLESDMRAAAKELDFEAAAQLRDQLFELRARKDGMVRRRDAFAEIRSRA
ncbi:MAG: UvrB/UvrC motif-containing protein [Gemmatimonadota bacterium]